MKKLERDLQEAKAGSEEKQVLYGKCVAQVAVLEKGIKEQGSLRETRLKDLEKKIKSLKSEIRSASKQLKVGLCGLNVCMFSEKSSQNLLLLFSLILNLDVLMYFSLWIINS